MATSVVQVTSLEGLLAQSNSLAEAAAVETIVVVVKPTLPELEKEALVWIARGKEANLQLGRVFCQMKQLCDHGEWVPYFNRTFSPHGIPLRTAQAYMLEANKNAEFALLNDEETAEVEAEADLPVETPSKKKPRGKSGKQKDGRYQLPLTLTSRESDALTELRNSQNWHA